MMERDDVRGLEQNEKWLEYIDDPVYSAVGRKAHKVIRFLVEVIKVESRAGLQRALAEDLKMAIYLREKGYPLTNGNHVYSLDAMKLVWEWGYRFDRDAVKEILHSWNGDGVLERLKFLYEGCGYEYLPEMEQLYALKDEVALYLYGFYGEEMYGELMMRACEHCWWACIDFLVGKGVEFSTIHFEKVAAGRWPIDKNYVEVDKWRKYVGLTEAEMVITALASGEDLEELYLFYRQKLPGVWKELVREGKLKFVNDLINWEVEYKKDDEFIVALIDDGVNEMLIILDMMHYYDDLEETYLFYRKRFPEIWAKLIELGSLNFVKTIVDIGNAKKNVEFMKSLIEDGVLTTEDIDYF